MKKQQVLLIGTGKMAQDYARVLTDLHVPFMVVGRSKEKLENFKQSYGGKDSILLKDLNKEIISSCSDIILCTSVESLAEITLLCLQLGAKRLLVEKPGFLNRSDFKAIKAIEENVFLRFACNRRYYQSVQKLKNNLKEEKVNCAFFDFTENLNGLEKSFSKPALKRWAFSNSIHVFDTISYLLGEAEAFNCHILGKNKIPWHEGGATFLGNGSFSGVPSSYQSSWEGPGRWNIEITCSNHKYKLSPMEKLQVVEKGSYDWKILELDYELDQKFKPGLHSMVSDFLFNDKNELPSIDQLDRLYSFIAQVVGYDYV